MKNIIKNTRGAALAVVIIIFAVVSIVGTTVLSVSLSQTTSSEAAEDTTAAYYYARSAVEIVSSNIEDKYEQLDALQAEINTLYDAANDDETVTEEEFGVIEQKINAYNAAVTAFDSLQLIPASAAETCTVQVDGMASGPATVKINLVNSGGTNVIELSCAVTYEGNTSSARAQIGTFAQTQATVEFSTTSTAYGPFGYGIFSDSDLNTKGNSVTINGDVHTNANYTAGANSERHNGSVEAVGTFKSSYNSLTITGTCMAATITTEGSQIKIADRVEHAADVIAMPDLSVALVEGTVTPDGTWQTYTNNQTFGGNGNVTIITPIYAKDGLKFDPNGKTTINAPLSVEGDLQFKPNGKTTINAPLYVKGNLTFGANDSDVNAPLYVTGDLTIKGNSISVKAPIYVKGKVNIEPNNFTTTHPVIATAKIYISTNSISGSWFYSTAGDIEIGANSIDTKGLIYAPKGLIWIHGNSLKLDGRIVGKTLKLDANSITINTGPNDLNVLSEVIETTTPESVEYTVYTPVYNRIWLR